MDGDRNGMTLKEYARLIYDGLVKHRIEPVFTCSFDELPAEYQAQLIMIAASLPTGQWLQLDKFKEWQKDNYHVTEPLERFEKMVGREYPEA